MSLIPPKPLPNSDLDVWRTAARRLLDVGIVYQFDLAGQPPCTCPAGPEPAEPPTTTTCLACSARAASRRLSALQQNPFPPPLPAWIYPWDDGDFIPEDH